MTCSNCCYCAIQPSPTKELRRYCHRFPPTACAVAVPVQGPGGVQISVQSISIFPTVEPDWKCGEFSPKLKVS